MAARAGGHGNQAVGALLDGLAREAVGDDVMQGDPAIGVDRLVQVLASAERGYDDRNLVFHAQLDVLLEPIVGLVHDLVDGERRRRRLRVGLVIGRQFLGDPGQPLVQLRDGAGVQRREGPDDASLALGDHQVRIADDEQRRGDDRKTQAVAQDRRQGHGGAPLWSSA